MIEFNANIKPYSAKNECGDFYEYIEFNDYYLLVVGDIGGHGSSKVYNIACQIKSFIIEHKNKELKELILLIHKQDILKNNGMTIFLAHVYKNTPIVSYCAIGNTKSMIYRNNNLMQLHTQDGILGYDIPSHIKVNITKVMTNDLLIIVTDGISLHNNQINSLLKQTKDTKEITKFFIENCSNDDDSLCVALKFDVSSKNHFSIKYNHIEDIKQIENITKQIPTNEHANLNTIIEVKKQILVKLDNTNLLVKQLQKDLIPLTMDKMRSLTKINKQQYIKIKTFLYEIIKYSAVNIYLKSNILQLHIDNIQQIKDSLEFLFTNFYISKNNSCIINIEFENYLKFTPSKFQDLKQMLELGLTDEGFAKFKKNEKEMDKLASQTRLSAMGEMIGNIAHQWRQPLSVISTSATGMMMQQEYGILTDDKLNQSCDIINENAQYLSKTIDDFKDFIKGDNKKENFTTKVLIDKSLIIVQSNIKDNYIELIIDNKQDINMYGALNMLMQVIVNIVNNAKDVLVEKNIEDKLLFISVDKKDDNIIISITDNGGGVPIDIIPKIFDAYFTTKHQSKGTGLGLNMAYSIIANSFNGTLEVKNTTYTYKDIQYTGAKFIITIPLFI